MSDKKNFAVAVSVKRRNKKPTMSPPKTPSTESMPMFASGGEASSESTSLSTKLDQILAEHDHNEVMEYMAGRMRMAEGGEAEMPFDGSMDEESSIADSIMKRRKYAQGGEVDLSMNADEEPNHEDDLSFEALKKENYSESEGLEDLDSPEDSNEHGDMRESSEEDDRDMISSIRKKMRMRNPGKQYSAE